MKSILILAFIITSNLAQASSVKVWSHLAGIIVLQNGDSLKGEVLLYEVLLPYPTAKSGTLERHHYLGFVEKYEFKFESEQKPKWIDYDKISYVKVFHNETHVDFTEFKNLNYGKSLWRLRKQKGSIAIFDDDVDAIIYPTGEPRKMILVKDGQITPIYSELGGLFGNLRALLRKFINKRYKKAFKKSDFKDTDELEDYILNNG